MEFKKGDRVSWNYAGNNVEAAHKPSALERR